MYNQINDLIHILNLIHKHHQDEHILDDNDDRFANIHKYIFTQVHKHSLTIQNTQVKGPLFASLN